MSSTRQSLVAAKQSLIVNKMFFIDTARILEFCSVQTVSLRRLRNYFENKEKLLCCSQFDMYLLELTEGGFLTQKGKGCKTKVSHIP